MVDPPLVTTRTFITPNWGGGGWLVWARIRDSWQRYEHALNYEDAERLARKDHRRLLETAERRQRDG